MEVQQERSTGVILHRAGSKELGIMCTAAFVDTLGPWIAVDIRDEAFELAGVDSAPGSKFTALINAAAKSSEEVAPADIQPLEKRVA